MCQYGMNLGIQPRISIPHRCRKEDQDQCIRPSWEEIAQWTYQKQSHSVARLHESRYSRHLDVGHIEVISKDVQDSNIVIEVGHREGAGKSEEDILED